MAYYHKKEVMNLKDDPVVQIQQKDLDNHFGDLYKKGAGANISLAEAARLAIQESDNTASFIVADNISQDDFNFVYGGLDIPQTLDKQTPITTPQEYSSILKALFFSSILNLDDSQYILSLMTNSKFSDMLPAGVPKNVPVAHKIGLIDKEIYQDCGIVYVPQRPYILCVVSKSDIKTARQRISDISKTVYDYVTSAKSSN